MNGLYAVHPRWVIDTLFACTAQTLLEFAANPRWMGVSGGVPAFSLVLHTWTQDLRQHVHLHAVMACGVLGQDDDSGSGGDGAGSRWHTPVRKPDFLFPGQALSSVFRGKYMAALKAAHVAGQLPRDRQGDQAGWCQRQRQLYRHDWVVYAKTPLGGPAQVLEYLSRYTHRTAIGNERIRKVSANEVVFTVRADDHGGKRRLRLGGAEFVRRFLLHVLPTGIKRIRHYGVLASACKAHKLAAARQALQMPCANRQATGSARAFMARVAATDVAVCPCCKRGRLRVVATLAGLQRLPMPGAEPVATTKPSSRGPP